MIDYSALNAGQQRIDVNTSLEEKRLGLQQMMDALSPEGSHYVPLNHYESDAQGERQAICGAMVKYPEKHSAMPRCATCEAYLASLSDPRR